MAFFRIKTSVLFGLWLCLGWAGTESLFADEAVAHGGGLDRCGGHHDRQTGAYHRHRASGGAECSGGSRSEVLPKEIFGKVERIVDGDTFRMEGIVSNVRLWGVDSPELRQDCFEKNGEIWRCGKEARTRLRSIVAGADEVSCVVKGKSYGRLVGRCFVGTKDIGEALVGDGLAVEDARYSRGRYGVRQAEARTAKMGIWRGCFTKPRRWRKRQRNC